MAKVQNTFLKSKMNKDLDARILPEGEYRDAQNAQISKSEGSQVGSLENVLGNVAIQDYKALTGVSNIICIGTFSDEINNTVYLFFTNYTDANPNRYVYNPTAKNFIISTNVLSNLSTVLVQGEFLNFSTTNQITGVNVLENLLFFTDNRNQPRVINIELANPTPAASPTFYTTEDQISVAKYNPHDCMELWEKSVLSTGDYETTMKDVSSLFLPNGGRALSTSQQTTQTVINIDNIIGEIQVGTSNVYGQPATVSLLNTQDNTLTDTGFVVDSIAQVPPTGTPLSYDITLSGAITVANNQVLVFNSNPYYQATFGGDPDYLESKFARFSCRFRFVDNEYSIFAPFTQIAFIPKQDGYFMFAESPSQEKNDQDEAYRSSVVYFVENKVNSIDLRIPLPFTNYTLENALKIKEIDILYKESDAVAVKVVETVPIDKVYNQSAVCLTDISVVGPSAIIPVKNIQGGISPGDLISGVGIPEGTTVVSFTPTNPSNQFNGDILISPTALTLDDDVLLTIGSPNYFVFKYRSTKPTKTLPSADLVRVFDKIPVRALAQEVSGNRVMYGNFLNKIDPPAFIDYNVAVTAKADFSLNEVTATYIGAGTIPAGDPLDIDLSQIILPPGGFFPGAVVTSNEFGVNIPFGTIVVSTNNNGSGVSVTSDVINTNTSSTITVANTSNFIPIGSELSGVGTSGLLVTAVTELTEGVFNVQLNGVASFTIGQIATFTLTNSTEAIITLNNTVTFPVGSVILVFEPGGQVENTTSKIEYPSSSVKGNRNYQVGFVLSDRYGRQSSVILSNNETSITVNGREYAGSTLYSPYIDEELNGGVTDWPGNSLKILVNNPINGNRYNGDTSSLEYNPLGWYSYKIVVKQTEQEYYNVYLPGIMASYPIDQTLEVGQTSHAVLINDNINKIPRDLTEVGPDQKQFRSSIQLFGRVQNVIPTNPITSGETNVQYYPGTSTDTVTVISTLNDLFDFDPSNPKQPNLFPQFYSLESNPLVARISTVSQIGQLANTNFSPSSGKIVGAAASDVDPITSNAFSVSNVSNDPALSSLINALVSGQGVPDDTYIASNTAVGGGATPTAGVMDITLQGKDGFTRTITLTPGVELVFTPTGGTTSIPAFALDTPGIQYLAVYETEAIESAIDIFWETSTSGVVSDLNDSILNNQSQPGGSNITWNPSDFTEGLAQDGFILNGNGFRIVDNFGVTITLNPNRLDPVTGAPDPDFVEIDSIFDNNNPPLNVNGDNTQYDYFRLIDTGFNTGGGPWQIQTTSVNSVPSVNNVLNYWSNVYYGNNQPARQFTFNFKIRIDGQDNIVTRTANLGNESPEFFLIEAFDGDFPQNQTDYGPGANPPSQIPASVPIRTVRSKSLIAQVYANNGAANQVLGSSGQPLSKLDVDFKDQGDGTRVWDQRIGNAAGDFALFNGDPIFELSLSGSLQGQIAGKLFNIQYENPGLPAALYIVTLAVEDAGTTVFQQFEIDMRLELGRDNIWNKLQESDALELNNLGPGNNAFTLQGEGPNNWYVQNGDPTICGNNCLRPGDEVKWHYFPSTLIRIKADTPGAGSSDVGWYLYAAGFFQNNAPDMDTCCPLRISPSLDLVDYSTGIVENNSNTITIPKNTPLGTVGHKVQFQDLSLFPEAANWEQPPLINSLIKVTDVSVDGKTWNYENLVGELSGCEKLFVDINAEENGGVYVPGNGWPDQGLRNDVGARAPRVRNIYVVNLPLTGPQKKFYYDTSVESNSASAPYVLDPNGTFPQYVYSYHGAFNADLSPWYFAPGDNYEALQDLWGMYSYSQWLASSWKKDRVSYAGWAPPFEDQPYNVNSEPELTPLGVTRGVQAQLQNGNPSQCTATCGGGVLATPTLFCNQAVRSENVSQFNFSII